MDAANGSATSSSDGGAHVLLVPLPAQGHTNPMLQLGRRLAYHGLRPTLALTRFVLSTGPAPGDPFRVVAISDGFDPGGMGSCADPVEYCRKAEAIGSQTLAQVIAAEVSAGRTPSVMVYDPHMSWARRVARDAGVPAAAFMSQSCAVDLIYGEAWAGRTPLPMADGSALRRRGAVSVDLGPDDLSPFLVSPELYPKYLDVSIRQFEGFEEVDDMLVNCFCELEPQVCPQRRTSALLWMPPPLARKYSTEAEYMASTWSAKTVGPLLPSFFLDDHRLPLNKAYGMNFFSSTAPCMSWLDQQQPGSVVLISYGTVYSMDAAELEELGNGLCDSGNPFLWVVRSGESQKIPEELLDRCKEKGLIVPWCPQLEVLAHRAIGCFLTHCGWNSTMEEIVCGVPMVAMPRSADQPTNAKYVESAWEIGVRMQANEKGSVSREEVEACLGKVMDGERKEEYRRNADKLMKMAKDAMQKGGSSDRNIAEFASKYSLS